jgi:hypothetical protein
VICLDVQVRFNKLYIRIKEHLNVKKGKINK